MSSIGQFALAHVAVMLCWTVVIGMLLGLGLFFRRLFVRESLADADPYLVFWTGYAIALVVLQLWHLARPIDGWILALLLMAGGAGLATERATICEWLSRLRPRRLSWTVVIGAVLLLWLANTALGPVSNFDGGAYHIPTVDWANAYRIVPGLGNLHGRLAFNSSSLLFAALLDIGPLDGRAFHIDGGVLILPLLLHSLGAVGRLMGRRSRSEGGDAFAASLVVLAVILVIAHEASSLATDLPVALVLLACGERLLRTLLEDAPDDALARWHFASVALLSASAVVLKLSAAVTAAALFVLACWTYRGVLARSTRQLPRLLVAPVVLVATWLGRGVILSGYPMYPSGLFAMPVAWRLPAEQTAAEAAWVRFSARVMNGHDIPVGPGWIAEWGRGLLRLPQDTVLLSVPLVLALLAALSIARSPTPPPGSSRRMQHLAPLFLAPLAGLVFWFAVAPHPRFAQGALWIIACTGLGIAFVRQRADEAGRAARVARIARGFALVLAVLVLAQATISPISLIRVGWVARAATAGGLLVRPGRDHGMHPTGAAKLGTYATKSGLRLVIPLDNNLCWRSGLTCTPHPSPYVRLRTPGDLGSGFIADSGRWEPVRWPDPLTPFLPYWRCEQRGAGADHQRACALGAKDAHTDTLRAVIQAQGGDTTGRATSREGSAGTPR